MLRIRSFLVLSVVVGLTALLTVACGDDNPSPTAATGVVGGTTAASGEVSLDVTGSGRNGNDGNNDDLSGPKVNVCHLRGDGSFRLIDVGVNSQAAHLGHGDHLPLTFYADADGDGFGAGAPRAGCVVPAGFVEDDTDADDGNATVFPGAPELCDDGLDNNQDGQVDENCGPVEFTVFATSTTHTANLGGLAGADATCNALASTAGLAGNFTAWLSDSNNDARDRLVAGASWSLVGGGLVANDLADLTDGAINAAINKDEHGATTPNNWVITGTDPDGTRATFGAPTDYCQNWTDGGIPGTDGRRQVTGLAGETVGWTRHAFQGPNCSEIGFNYGLHRLYCFQTAP